MYTDGVQFQFSFLFFNILNDLNTHDITGSICADKIVILLKEKKKVEHVAYIYRYNTIT